MGSIVVVSGTPLDYVTFLNIPAGWNAVNKHDCLKYKAIHIGPSWEAKKMTVYKKLKACFLDGEVWSYIKVYGVHKYGVQAT